MELLVLSDAGPDEGLLSEHGIAHGVCPELLVFPDLFRGLFHLTALLDSF